MVMVSVLGKEESVDEVITVDFHRMSWVLRMLLDLDFRSFFSRVYRSGRVSQVLPIIQRTRLSKLKFNLSILTQCQDFD